MTERFISPCPQPSAFDRELLEILSEECAEVIQRAIKSIRFGSDDIQKDQPFNNRYRLGLEVGDLFKMISMCVDRGLIDTGAIQSGYIHKTAQLAKYMQHQP